MQNIYNTKNCIYLGNVFHARLRPKQHKLNYNVFYLNINLREIKNKSSMRLLSFNKFNLFSFYDKDHGPMNCKDIDIWIRTLIKKNNNGYKFYLIDLNRMRFKSLTLKERLKNFKRLKMNDEVLKKVSEYYADLIKIDKQLIFKSIKKYSENFENNRIFRKRLKFFFRI